MSLSIQKFHNMLVVKSEFSIFRLSRSKSVQNVNIYIISLPLFLFLCLKNIVDTLLQESSNE